MIEFEKFVLGLTARAILLDNLEDNARAILALIAQAKHSIYIYSYQLEPEIYENPVILGALIRFLRFNPHVEVKVLLHDDFIPHRKSLHWLEISRRPASLLEMRQAPQYCGEHQESFLIVDGAGILWRQYYFQYQGMVNFYAPGHALEKQTWHQQVWQNSTPSNIRI